MAIAAIPSPGFHLCIDAPGQDPLIIIQAAEEVLHVFQNLLQNGWLTVLHNVTGVERGTQELLDGGWVVGRVGMGQRYTVYRKGKRGW